jgi:ABC-type uncharacterized transport system permease subunit
MDSDHDKLLTHDTKSIREEWRYPRAVIWCLLAHGVLIVVHGVLWLAASKHWDHMIHVSEKLASSHFQTFLTFLTSTFGTVRPSYSISSPRRR